MILVFGSSMSISSCPVGHSPQPGEIVLGGDYASCREARAPTRRSRHAMPAPR